MAVVKEMFDVASGTKLWFRILPLASTIPHLCWWDPVRPQLLGCFTANYEVTIARDLWVEVRYLSWQNAAVIILAKTKIQIVCAFLLNDTYLGSSDIIQIALLFFCFLLGKLGKDPGLFLWIPCLVHNLYLFPESLPGREKICHHLNCFER